MNDLCVMGRGLIGGAIREIASKVGLTQPDYSDFDGQDLTDGFELTSLQMRQPSKVYINAIGLSTGMKEVMENPWFTFYRNTQSAIKPIEALPFCTPRPDKYVTILTSCSYPDSVEPLKEENFLKGDPNPTIESHAYAKRNGFLAGRFIHKQIGFHAFGYVLNNTYGSRDKFYGGKIVGTLIGRFDEAIKNGDNSITLWGTGNAKREVLYNLDCALMIVDAISKYNDVNEPINLGSGKDYTIKEIAETVADVMGFDGKIEWDHTKPEGAQRKILSVDKMNSLNIKKPVLSLREGIDLTVKWFRDTNYDYLTDYCKKAGL